MKRRKFFQLASSGAEGISFATACNSLSNNATSAGSGTAAPFEVPDYRKTIKTTFQESK